MKGFSHFLTLGLLAAAVLLASPRASAQAFGLSVTPSVSSLRVSNSLTYTINVTNFTSITFPDVWVTNTFSGPIQYITATASQTVSVLHTNTTTVWFDFMPLYSGVVQVSLTVQPNATGFLTNTVIVTDTTTNTASASVVVQVTNVPPARADLGVTMTGPRQPIITNDWMTYGVTVINAGPDAAANVMLTNIVPSGVIGISLPKQNSGTNSPISLGTLASGGSTNLFFTVEPTNAGDLQFSASVGAPGVTDTNLANNLATNNITVTNYLPSSFVIVTNSGQNIDFADGAMQQSILVSNAGPSLVPAVRVVVAGLTNQLFNAVGTNNGDPFVYYSTNLPAGRSVSLLLEFFPRESFALTTNQLRAFAVPVPDWTPPPMSATRTNINISRIIKLNNGWILIEFPTTPGRSYTVVYSKNVLFSNAMIAPPSIVAPADRMQWLDYGPPETVSAPTNASARFYRVYQNP